MKDYKRLTQYVQVGNNIVAIQPQRKERIQLYIDRLFELEDKIESGELCDREEVKKETAREILERIKNMKKNGYTYEAMIAHLSVEYGFELFGNFDKLEDEE